MKAQILKKVSKADFEDLSVLNQQVSGSGEKLQAQNLRRLLAADADVLVLREKGRIIGTATLNYEQTLSKLRAALNHVVVDEAYRGRGLGRMLMEAVLKRARVKKVKEIRFTSNPRRVAANAMYQKMGFEKYETNVYRMKL